MSGSSARALPKAKLHMRLIKADGTVVDLGEVPCTVEQQPESNLLRRIKLWLERFIPKRVKNGR
jgi:light-regulated signal transduction histidine kinase (bacteriophytochrome)